MPKEFSQWVADMANSIEDTSTFIKPTHNTSPLTSLQKRLHIADLLIPDPDTEDSIHSWITCFCIGYDEYNEKVTTLSFWAIAGDKAHKEYYSTEGYRAAKAWLNNFRQQVLLGKIK